MLTPREKGGLVFASVFFFFRRLLSGMLKLACLHMHWRLETGGWGSFGSCSVVVQESE